MIDAARFVPQSRVRLFVVGSIFPGYLAARRSSLCQKATLGEFTGLDFHHHCQPPQGCAQEKKHPTAVLAGENEYPGLGSGWRYCCRAGRKGCRRRLCDPSGVPNVLESCSGRAPGQTEACIRPQGNRGFQARRDRRDPQHPGEHSAYVQRAWRFCPACAKSLE